jgi:tetratricopeptide (TPR) repeat protein/CHAT domain-containing protein
MAVGSLGRQCNACAIALASFLVVAAHAESNKDLPILAKQVEELHKKGRYAEAITISERALALAERLFGQQNSQTIARLNTLVELLQIQGRYSEAEHLAVRALTPAEKVLGREDAVTLVSVTNLAVVYQFQNRYGAAEPLIKRAVDTSERVLGREHPETLNRLDHLAGLYQDEDRRAEAEEIYKRVLAIRVRTLRPSDQKIADSLNNLAVLYRIQGRFAEAEPLLKRAYTIREKILGPKHPDVAYSLNQLAVLYDNLGRNTEAEALYKRALVIEEEALGSDHPSVATTLNNLGQLYTAKQNYAAAEPVLKRALAIGEKVFGSDRPGVDGSLYALAYLYAQQDRYSEAETLYRRAIAIGQEAFGPENPLVGRSLNALTLIYDEQGRYADAEPLYRQVLAIAEKSFGPNHINVAVVLSNLARLYIHQARYTDAEPLYQRALAVSEKALGTNHPIVLSIRSALAKLYQSLGRYEQAESLKKNDANIHEIDARSSDNGGRSDELSAAEDEIIRLNKQGKYAEATEVAARVLALFERKFGSSHPKIAKPLMNLAHAYSNQKRIADAEALYRRAIEILREALGPDHADTEVSILQLSRFYSNQQRYAEAEPLYNELLEIDERVHGKDHPDTVKSAKYLAQLYANMRRYDKAEAVYKRILETEERVRGKDDGETLNTKGLLAQVYEDMGRYDEAETLEKQILETKEHVLGVDHPKTLTSVAELAGIYDDMGRQGEAERLYKRALEGRERVLGRSDFETLKTANNLGSLYLHYGRYSEAAVIFKRVLDSNERADKDNDVKILALGNLAVAYVHQGQFVEAETLLKRALETAEQLRGKEHPDTLRNVLNLAVLYLEQKQYVKAEPLLKRVIHAGGADAVESLEATRSLAVLYSFTKRLAEAGQLYMRVFEIQERQHVSDPLTLNNLALNYLMQGDWANAVKFLRRASVTIVGREQREAEGIGKVAIGNMETKVSEHRSEFINLVKALSRLTPEDGGGSEAVSLEMFETAQRALSSEAATSLARMALRSATGKPALAAVVRDRQDLLEEWQKLDALHNKAIALPLEQRDATGEAEILSRLKSIDNRIAGLDNRLAAEFPDFTELAGHPPLSVKDVQAYLKPNEALVLFLDTPVSAAPEETFVWVVTKTDMRLVRSEEAGTPVLTSAVASLRCGLDRAGNWEWVEAEQRWRATNEICNSLKPDGLAADDGLPFDAALAHSVYHSLFANVEDLIKDKSLIIVPSGPLTQLPFQVLVRALPKEVPSGRQQREIVKLGAELKDLSDDDRHRLRWIEQDGVKIVKAEKGSAAETAGLKADDILIMVGKKRVGMTQNAIEAIRDHAPDSTVQLTLWRNGSKQNFHVVLGRATMDEWQPFYWNAKNSRAIGWLARDHPITVLPAVSSLKALREFARQSHATELFIGFGNPLLDGEPTKYPTDAEAAIAARAARCPAGTAQQVAPLSGRRGGVRAMGVGEGGVADLTKIRIQQPLPETAQELCDVAQDLGVDPASHLYIGAKATEAEVKQLSNVGRLAKYKIIHFATHGAVAGQLSGTSQPGLILTPPQNASEADDGYLSASEIANLRLDADWVILSACNTAAGGAENAEALSGVARAFFYAGARSLLVSHWAVNSDAAVTLITKTVSELNAAPEIGRAEALRRSMLSMITTGKERGGHPAFWAPFALVGEGAAAQ